MFLCWICIECISSEPLWKMYLHGNKHFLNLNLNLNGQNVLMQRHSCTGYQIKMSLEKVEAMSRKYGFTSPKCSNSLTKCNNGYLNGKITWVVIYVIYINVEEYIYKTIRKPQKNRHEFHLTITKLQTKGHFYWNGLTLIPAWISNYIHYKEWDEITSIP